MIDLDDLAPYFLVVLVLALSVALAVGFLMPAGSEIARAALLLGLRP